MTKFRQRGIADAAVDVRVQLALWELCAELPCCSYVFIARDGGSHLSPQVLRAQRPDGRGGAPAAAAPMRAHARLIFCKIKQEAQIRKRPVCYMYVQISVRQ